MFNNKEYRRGMYKVYLYDECMYVCMYKKSGRGSRVKEKKRKSGREVKNRRLEEKPKIKVQLQSGVNVTQIIYLALQTERQSRINQGQLDYRNGIWRFHWHLILDGASSLKKELGLPVCHSHTLSNRLHKHHHPILRFTPSSPLHIQYGYKKVPTST